MPRTTPPNLEPIMPPVAHETVVAATPGIDCPAYYPPRCWKMAWYPIAPKTR